MGYAVIATGGKQYKVQEGDIVKVERFDGEVGSPVTFENVLMHSGPSSIRVSSVKSLFLNINDERGIVADRAIVSRIPL